MIDLTKILNVNTPNFERVINSGKLVLVDFWAEWCQPCKVMNPILEAVAKESGDDVIIAKLNVDDNRFVSQNQGVANIPTIIFYKDGKPLERVVGVQSKDTLISKINKHK